ncbi:hypothetical protein [Xylanimonas ulmi]|uniref:Uncharacterized protein n=1 Tax=Xylanimonas ulmi TaxID=228973 RepID=A0A4V2EYI5_9MICO|nr:hypothetical protein [Xylanibacterium ulmi]RZS63110.1 hypothetical protein EV386_3468 [Xylanibacterium ulmi]
MRQAVVTGYTLAFTDRWFPLPPPATADWARGLAGEILGRADDEARVAELERALREVEEAARTVDLPAQTAAVLARTPGAPVLDATLIVGVHPHATRELFELRMAEWRDGRFAGGEVMSFTEVTSSTPAGAIVGCHLLVGRRDPHSDAGVAYLEERVMLGVVPDVTRGVIEVTAVAAHLGAFADMAQEVLDLVAALSVTTENA